MFNIDYEKVNTLKEKINNSISALSKYSYKIELITLNQIRNDLEIKLKDFETREKKLRIGVIGQVKAGKSSFINSLLFKGEEVLPKAATPKTANLTVIKYGEKYSIELEFYNKDEFKEILNNASLDINTEEVKVAKEIKELYNSSGIDIETIDDNVKTMEVEDIKELEGILDDYAGENGKYTAITKSITLYINDERLKEVEIIDTPGLNDPVLSRTIKTKELLKKADAVFFLSICSQFLDKTDIDLIVRQLPAEGVRKFIIVASKLDSALMDVGWDTDSYKESVEDIKEDLTNRANNYLNNHIFIQKSSPIEKLIKSALPPIFISSMAYNLAIKDKLSEEEQHILGELNSLWNDFKFDKEKLKELANFEKISELLENIIKEKEKILDDKLNNFIPSVENNLKEVLKSYKDEIIRRIKNLQEKGVEHLVAQKNIFENNKFEIASAILEVINNVKSEILKKKEDFKKASIEFMKQAQKIREREGTEVHTSSRWVSTSKWYNPFSWGSGYTETSTYTTSYKYYLAVDAAENIVNFANETINLIEKNFNEALDTKKIRLSLKKRLIDIIDTASEDYSPDYFKYIIESSIEIIEIPSISISYQSFIDKINAKFQGEIKEGNMGELKKELIDALLVLHNEIKNTVEAEIKNINFILDNIKDDLMSKLTEKIANDIKRLEDELKNKELELENYKKMKNDIERLID